ncbi:hypothetical protein N7G274_004973 [Stereocaulon virgatum]|uniref:Amidohydrolase 3 domain-containing protein n=1 Tax=Stereocaulon virgatum TaxID=373712 RepID=A0ABR4ABJ7_9LECA
MVPRSQLLVLSLRARKLPGKVAGAQVHIKYLKGNCLLPGFIEPHLHVLLAALAKGSFIDFSPLQVKSRAEAEAVIREQVANIKDEASWVAGFGWDPSRVAQHCDLTIDLLHAWSERMTNGGTVHVPVFIDNLSGHLAYVNTEVLNRAGIPLDTTDPNFTRKDGKLTGIVVELGIVKVAAPIPKPSTVD